MYCYCQMENLMEVLFTNVTNDMAEPLSLQQTIDKRDALANFVYESMFHWLVGEINKSFEGDKQHTRHTISIIDTYGFESFQKNSFQQLLINYADERLQQHFIRHLCNLEQKVHLGDTPNSLNESDFESLARKAEGFSGSDIVVCVKDVLFEPVRKLKMPCTSLRLKRVCGYPVDLNNLVRFRSQCRSLQLKA